MYRAVMLFLALTFSPAGAMAQQPCTTDARQVVNEVYRHILERGADSGSANWVQQLENGRMTVRDVVREIARSNEHTQRFWRQESGEETPYLRAVGTIYRHILGRQPDVAGARTWAEVGTRNGVGAVIDQIVSSREYDNQFGDWGVPGSGGIQYCAPNNRVVSQRPAAVVRGNRRFQNMDGNNDGVISRNEWRGNAQAFQDADWNNDGILSGDEVDVAVTRPRGRAVGNVSGNRAARFNNLDANRNGRIEPREWDGTVATFTQLDVNNDNVLTQVEIADTGYPAATRAVPTSGQVVNVDSSQRWTDTGIFLQAGETILFDVNGTIQMSSDPNDVAGPGGAHSGRRAPAAPLSSQTAGALLAEIGDSGPIFVGNRRSIRAPVSGRLSLGVNDDHLGDNSGHFRVMVTVQDQ